MRSLLHLQAIVTLSLAAALSSCVDVAKPENFYDVAFQGVETIDVSDAGLVTVHWLPAETNRKEESLAYLVYVVNVDSPKLETAKVIKQKFDTSRSPAVLGSLAGTVINKESLELGLKLKPGQTYAFQVKVRVGDVTDDNDVTVLYKPAIQPEIQITGGNFQTGVPKQEFAAPLRIQLTEGGSPLPDKSVVFSLVSGPTGGALSFTQTASTTDAQGIAQTFFTPGDLAGVTVIAAQWKDLKANFTLTTEDQTDATLEILGGNEQVAAPGVKLALPLSVSVKRSSGQAAAGVLVRFVITEGNGRVGEQPLYLDKTSNTAGVVEAEVYVGTKAGSNRIKAMIVERTSESVEFSATTVVPINAPIDLAQSVVTASPTSMKADGVATTTLTFYARDKYGNQIPAGGGTIRFTPDIGALVGSVTDLTDGTYTQQLRGPSQIDSTSITIGATSSSVSLLSPKAKVVLKAGNYSLAQSTVTVNPTSVVANGTSTISITVTLKDDLGNQLSSGGNNVSITANKGTLVGTPIDAGDGTYTQLLRAPTLIGTATVNAAVDGSALFNPKTVTFRPGPIDLSKTTIVASPARLPPNGTSVSGIRVAFRDQFGNEVSDTTGIGAVAINTTNTDVSWTGAVTANGDGTYARSLRASNIETTAVITATVGGAAVSSQSYVFVANSSTGPSPIFSKIDVLQGYKFAADGTAITTIRVSLRDGSNQPISVGGSVVAIATSAGTLKSAGVTDNGNGTYDRSIQAPATSAEAVITATVNGLNIVATRTVQYYGDMDLTKSVLNATPPAIEANGTSLTTISVQAKDASGIIIPVGGAGPLTFTSSRGTPASGTLSDNGNGKYTAFLTASATAGQATVQARKAGATFASTTVDMYAPTPVAGGTLIDCSNIATYKNKPLLVQSGTVTMNSHGDQGICPDDFVFSSLVIKSGGIITHSATTMSIEYGLELTAGSIDIQSGGKIDVTGKGYVYTGGITMTGVTHGLTVVKVPTTYEGNGSPASSYGGTGSNNSKLNSTVPVTGTSPYGSLFRPFALGASGIKYVSTPVVGGGRVKLTAGFDGNGVMTVSGAIISNSTVGGNGEGGGTGGSIWLRSGTIQGNGQVDARASSVSTGNHLYLGGGGRIAIYYDHALDGFALPGPMLQNVLACSGIGDSATRTGAAGTIYLKAKDQVYGDLVINNCNVANDGENATFINVPNPATADIISPTTLSRANQFGGAYVSADKPFIDFYLNPKVNQNQSLTMFDDVIFKIKDTTEHSVEIDQGDLQRVVTDSVTDQFELTLVFDNVEIRGKARLEGNVKILALKGDLSSNDDTTVNVAGSLPANIEYHDAQNLTIDGSGALEGIAMPQNNYLGQGNYKVPGDLTLKNGTFTFPMLEVGGNLILDNAKLRNGTEDKTKPSLIVGGDITLINAAVIGQLPTTETSELYLYITAENIDVCATCTIQADYRGYAQPSLASAQIKGPNLRVIPKGRGGGTITPWSSGHGGLGVYSGGISGSNQVYDNIFRPVWSSVSVSPYSPFAEGGGGAIHIMTRDSLVVNGKISANAGGSVYAAAGGSIWIETNTLGGSSGTISANGRSRATSYSGGGGRIAIYYTTATGQFTPSSIFNIVEARAGLGNSISNNAAPGTIYLKSSSQQFGDLIIDAKGQEQGVAYTPIIDDTIPVFAIAGAKTSTYLDSLNLYTTSSFKNDYLLENEFNGLYLNPNVGQNASTTISDDVLFKIISNQAATLTVEPAPAPLPSQATLTTVGTGGNNFRLVLVLDNLEVRGKARLFFPGHDIYVLNGDLSSNDTTSFRLDGEIKARTLDLNGLSDMNYLTTGNTVQSFDYVCLQSGCAAP